MTNAVQTTSNANQAMVDPKKMAERINLIHSLVKTVMKNGVHFGTVPGCGNKPTLFLPGAQVLKVAFKIATRYIVEDLSTPGEKTFRVTAEVFDQTTGDVLGYGMGECSSNEEKYAWRKSICDEEFDATLEQNKRIKYGTNYGKTITTKQIRTNPADIANTVLKMATKRADVHGTINVTSASEVFTQDLEDLPEGYATGEENKESSKPKVSEKDVSIEENNGDGDPTEDQIKDLKLISAKQVGFLTGECKKNNVTPESIAIYAKVKSIHWLTWVKSVNVCFEKILKTVQEKPEFFQKYQPKPKAAPEPIKPAEEKPTEVMGDSEFIAMVESNCKELGLTMDKAEMQMDMEFGFKNFKEIPADQQSVVIDWLNSLKDQAGA